MKKLMHNFGFTLAEMLIVVAIVAILTAIAIPTFTNQGEKAKEVADVANLRSAYSEATSAYLMNPNSGETQTIEKVSLASNGALDYVDAGVLPFVLPEDFAFAKGTYTVTFDLSADKPTVTLSRREA